MECIYKFRVNKPSDKISVIIDQSDKEGKLLFASQDGVVKDLSEKKFVLFLYFSPINDI